MLPVYNVSCFALSESPWGMLRNGWKWQPFLPIMPLLAPLIYRMSAQDVEHRFTAAEALAFGRYVRQTYSDLNCELPLRLSRQKEISEDPWQYLSEYMEQWLPKGSGWANIASLSARSLQLVT